MFYIKKKIFNLFKKSADYVTLHARLVLSHQHPDALIYCSL